MSFTFTEHPEFQWPVRVDQPKADGGFVTHTFTATFLEVPEDDFWNAHDGETVAERIEHDRAFLSRVWIGWEGILTDDGSPLAVTDAHKANLLGQRSIRTAVGVAFKEAYIDGNRRAGNSAAPRA